MLAATCGNIARRGCEVFAAVSESPVFVTRGFPVAWPPLLDHCGR